MRVKSCIRALGTVALTSLLLAGCAGKDEPENPGTPPRVRVITTQQYLNTVANVFGSSVSMDMKFPPLRRTDGSARKRRGPRRRDCGQDRNVPACREQHRSPGRRARAPQLPDLPARPPTRRSRIPNAPKQFFSQTGRLLHRRKLSDEELGKYVTAANMAADKLNDFYAGIELTLESMLISPEVLFIVESSDREAGQEWQPQARCLLAGLAPELLPVGRRSR